MNKRKNKNKPSYANFAYFAIAVHVVVNLVSLLVFMQAFLSWGVLGFGITLVVVSVSQFVWIMNTAHTLATLHRVEEDGALHQDDDHKSICQGA